MRNDLSHKYRKELEQMEILYRSLHNLDLNMDIPIRKEIPSDFNSYIARYINFATTENKISRMYSVPNHNTTVVHCAAGQHRTGAYSGRG